MKSLFRSAGGAFVAVAGQEPFFVPRERYVEIKLQPTFDELPLEVEACHLSSANRLRGRDRQRADRLTKPITTTRKARS